MPPTYYNIARLKLIGLIAIVRMRYYRILGLRFGKNCKIGRVVCDWPNKVIFGDKCVVLDKVILGIGDGFNDNKNIKVGNRVFIGYSVEFNCTNSICIGDDVLIATGTKIVDVGHSFALGKLINQQPLKSLPIVIENDVWIAANCIIIGGVTIGEGSVVGAGSVVTKSIPSNEIWGGAPARFIKKRVP